MSAASRVLFRWVLPLVVTMPCMAMRPVVGQTSAGQLGTGLDQLQRVSENLERQLGSRHPLTLRSWALVASLLEIEGDFHAADQLYRRVLEARLALLGEDNLDTAEALTALAGLRTKQGRFDEAQALHSRALVIRERHLGPSAPITLESKHGLAMLASQQGRWVEAERLLRQVLLQRRRQLGSQQPETLLALNSLGMLMERQSRWLEAENFYRQALAGFEKVWGRDDLAPALVAENLARSLMVRGRASEAEALQRRALMSRERLLGVDSPRLGIALGNLAETLTVEGRVDEARGLLERAVQLLARGAGSQFPETITLRQNLAINHWLHGRSSEAIQLFAAALDDETLNLQREVPLQPRADRASLLASVGDAWLVAFSLAAEQRDQPEAVDLALRARLNRQGLLQSLERFQAVLQRQAGSRRDLFERLQALQTKLADLTLERDRRQQLESLRLDLERQLYRQLPQIQPRIVTPAAVQVVLPADAVLVELQRYEAFDPRQPPGHRWGESRWLALVLPSKASGRQPRLISLGPAAPFEQAIAKARAATLRGQPEAEQAWLQVADQLWTPLRPSLQGLTQVELSLDGDLHHVPLTFLQQAAPVARVQVLTSGRDLLPEPEREPGPSVVIADPAFEAGSPRADVQGSLRGLGSWSRLPATLKEGRQVAQGLGVPLIHGAAATVQQLAQVRHPLVLHVATHGYFLPEPARLRSSSLSLAVNQNQWTDPRVDPLLRSGLVLAGRDRYLTASGVAQMDLSGTRLVTLSACDTGRGVQRLGEAVYGLQRSLRVAGARMSLLSLWKVDDQATQAWMERFYRLARQGIPLAEAVQRVGQQFRTDPSLRARGWSHPFYWAAWQLVGPDGVLFQPAPAFREDAGSKTPAL